MSSLKTLGRNVVLAIVFLMFLMFAYQIVSGGISGDDDAILWLSTYGIAIAAFLCCRIGSPQAPKVELQEPKGDANIPESVRSILWVGWSALVLGLMAGLVTEEWLFVGLGIAVMICLRELASRRFYKIDAASWAAHYCRKTNSEFSISFGGDD